MKNKDNIHPPSKITLSGDTEEQKARERMASLHQDYERAKREYEGIQGFDETVKLSAAFTGNSENTVRGAFKDSKGELVKKFKQRQAVKSDVRYAIIATPICSTLTGFTIFEALTADKGAFFFSGLSTLYGAIALSTGLEQRKRLRAIDSEIDNRTLEFKNTARLPRPS